MSFREYIELAKKEENQDNEDDEWIVYDEYMRRHHPIRPPEVKLCYFCKRKSIATCSNCDLFLCSVHKKICHICQSIICLICVGDEELGKSYCQKHSE